METLIQSPFSTEQFNVDLHFDHLFCSYGHWTIRCHAEFEGEKRTFTHITTNSQFIDEVSELSYDDAQKAYSDWFLDSFEEDIFEWCESLIDESN